jgi:pimeloyl-ACP methyl ester carboxylesterase
MFAKLFAFIAETIEGWRNLRWRLTPPKYYPLPSHITRTYTTGPKSGLAIEILVCQPKRPSSSSPVLFMHGGFGHAAVWLEWMTYLHEHGYPGTLYAVSARGHGASQAPSSWSRLVFLTKHDDISDDLLAACQYVKDREATEPILIGHSAGGEQCQYVLAKGMTTTPALGLIGAVPYSGIAVIFDNWKKIDPPVFFRGLLHANHPKSSLSTIRMAQNAFFGPDKPKHEVAEFMKWSADYEVLQWPFASLGSKKNGLYTWLDPGDIVNSISSWKPNSDRILVLQGSEDALMVDTHDRMVSEYRRTCHKVSGLEADQTSGVRSVIIQRGGHHIQNDVQWREGAAALLDWLRQV